MISVRACTDNVWGWSAPAYAATLPKLTVRVSGIGEDIVTVSQERAVVTRKLHDKVPLGTEWRSPDNHGEEVQLELLHVQSA
jgi:hypothetical protein